MKEHFNHIFVNTDCPSQQQLLDYIQGKLSAEQQHAVEMHVADCKLCSEALDGLAVIKNKEKIPKWINQMKWDLLKKLHTRYRSRRKINNYLYLIVIVCCILFLVLMLYWAYQFSLQHK